MPVKGYLYRKIKNRGFKDPQILVNGYEEEIESNREVQNVTDNQDHKDSVRSSTMKENSKEVVNTLSHRETYNKKTYSTIRISILEAIDKYPMSVHEVSDRCKLDWRTAKKHLEYLKLVDRASNYTITINGKPKTLWKTIGR